MSWNRGAHAARWRLVCATLVLAAACGDEEGSGAGADGGGKGDGDGTVDLNLTLVNVTSQDDTNPIATPHEILLTNSDTGEPIEGFEAPILSEAVTGKVVVEGLPAGQTATLHVIGNDEGATPTYDTISLNVPDGTGEYLLRVGITSLKAAAEQTGGFEVKQDHASVAGAVYWTPGGPGNLRMGTIGCVEIFLDGKSTAADEESAQRYVNDNGLPSRIAVQDKTNRTGQFYFGNLTKGSHTIEARLGDEVLGTLSFDLPYAQEDALGSSPAILYLVGMDVDAPENPTPDTCEGVY